MPWLHGSEEACNVSDLGPTGSHLFVGLLGYRGFSNVTLVCSMTDTPVTPPTTATTPTTTSATTTRAPTVLKPNTAIGLQGKKGDRLEFLCPVRSGKTTGMVVKLRKKPNSRHDGSIELYASMDRDNVLGGGWNINDCVKTWNIVTDVDEIKCKKFSSIGKTLHITVHAVENFRGIEIKCRERS